MVDDGRVFRTNSNSTTIERMNFEKPFKARSIRICPVSWHGHISLRCEAYYLDEEEQRERQPTPTHLSTPTNLMPTYYQPIFLAPTALTPTFMMPTPIATPPIATFPMKVSLESLAGTWRGNWGSGPLILNLKSNGSAYVDIPGHSTGSATVTIDHHNMVLCDIKKE